MVIFGAGVVTGGFLVRLAAPAPLSTPSAAVQPPVALPAQAGVMRLEFLRRAQRELELTADQRERIGRILRESQERTRHLMEPVTPQIREELKRTRAEFVQVLTPDQRKRFEELAREQKKQQQRAREPRNAPPSLTPREDAPLEAFPTNNK